MVCNAALVFRRYLRYQRSKLEILYGLAFITFGLSDVREAFSVQSWLILFKGANLLLLFFLSRRLLRDYYPTSRAF